ncbi:hypothetical protein ABXN37_28825, partial [Piscinibacter sakaiensis]|uniref:hypothetical protein n=1 Tax=Piscinibacter sakaiensis TaxID=1547922 RepID=UPI00372B5127
VLLRLADAGERGELSRRQPARHAQASKAHADLLRQEPVGFGSSATLAWQRAPPPGDASTY